MDILNQISKAIKEAREQMKDFFGALTPSVAQSTMGSGYGAMVLSVVTMFVGLFVIVVPAQKGVKAAVILGMLVSSVIYWAGQAIFLNTNPFASLAGASFVPPVVIRSISSYARNEKRVKALTFCYGGAIIRASSVKVGGLI